MKTLLIEDEKLLADTLTDLLSAKGFRVEAVCDGETGAEYALLGIYDLLILWRQGGIWATGSDGVNVFHVTLPTLQQ